MFQNRIYNKMNKQSLDKKVVEKEILVFNDEPIDLEISLTSRRELIPYNLPCGLRYHINKILEQYESVE